MDACKSVHALNSANRTESFLRQAPFFWGGGGAVGFWFLVSGNFWLALCCYSNNFGEIKPSEVVAIF